MRIGYLMKNTWKEGECSQYQELEEPALSPLEALTMTYAKKNSCNSFRHCSDKHAKVSKPATCNDEALLSGDNLMANSSLIMLSQMKRA
jgi:hypothetical protein